MRATDELDSAILVYVHMERVLIAMDDIVIPAFTRALGRVAPVSWWYRAAFRVSSALATVGRLQAASAPDAGCHDARILNRILSLLTRTGRPFDIPWRATGTALLAPSGPLVLCSAHIPLVKVGLRAAMELGRGPTVALAGQPGHDNAIAIWGLRERLPALRTQPNVLLRARTVLRSGGSVALLLDADRGAPLSPNILRLAGRLGARVVFWWTELECDGTIHVTFAQPPDPSCRTEAGIAANLAALAGQTRRIMRRT